MPYPDMWCSACQEIVDKKEAAKKVTSAEPPLGYMQERGAS